MFNTGNQDASEHEPVRHRIKSMVLRDHLLRTEYLALQKAIKICQIDETSADSSRVLAEAGGAEAASAPGHVDAVGVLELPEVLMCVKIMTGTEGFDGYETFSFSNDAERDDVTVVLKKINEYFGIKSNVTLARYRFNTGNQEDSENMNHMVLRDHFLRTEDLTLQKAIKICQIDETSADSSRVLEEAGGAEAASAPGHVDAVGVLEPPEVLICAKIMVILLGGLRCLPGKYHITVDRGVKPVVYTPLKVPLSQRDNLKAELDRMTELGVFRKVTHPTPRVKAWFAWLRKMVKYVYV
ncbi:RETRotransposon family member [Danaus plexippus plexippus]|uniref:RETRotransposon family member n=1 Tax=Danaus plexippus plexippus TaxID=278856 RepID=A0A212EZ80_DANPL|nr:RETRotransposon family member [Danaus plexippus plexippus]